jgi:hypothetical protein
MADASSGARVRGSNKTHDLFTLADVSNLHNGTHLPIGAVDDVLLRAFRQSRRRFDRRTLPARTRQGRSRGVRCFWTNAPNADFSRKLVSELIKPEQDDRRRDRRGQAGDE